MNTGNNYAEAVNFCGYDTLPRSRRYIVCSCEDVDGRYDNNEWEGYCNVMDWGEFSMWYGEKTNFKVKLMEKIPL